MDALEAGPTIGATSIAEERERLAFDVIALGAILATAIGVGLLASGQLGYDRGAALDGVLSQLPVTIPAGLLVLGAALLEVAVGATLMRIATGRVATDAAELVVGGAVAAVVKDVALVGVLGQVGLFSRPVLLAVDLAILAIAWRVPSAHPLPDRSVLRVTVRSSPILALILLVAAGAVALQLASPVVPFLDVLPNHVAPAEHLRTFGSFDPLTATQSPIYGPSRSFLGYIALLGGVTTMTGLPAGLAIAGFILPLLILALAGVSRLAGAVAGPGLAAWAMLAFLLSGPFGRLTDARATVVVLPLAAWALARVADRLAAPGGDGPPADRGAGAPSRTGLLPDSVVLGLGLGVAVLVHPVVGALAVATVLCLAIVRPAPLAGLGIPAVATAAVVALPQAATMVGIALPAATLVLALVAGVAVGAALDRARAVHRPLVLLGRAGLVVAGILALLEAAPVVRAVVEGDAPLAVEMEISVVVALVGLAAGIPAVRSPVVVAGLLVGAAVAAATQLVPEGRGFLTDSLRYELPKTLHYWFPIPLGVAVAATMAGLWARRTVPLGLRAAFVAAFLLAAALPLRATPIDAQHIGEHRFSESLAIDLRHAGRGYWAGYPDARLVVDAPRREILDAIRAEIVAGRLHADTPVLHVASSFQQWVATPLGVFTGVTETDVTDDAVENIHTVGGRLRPSSELRALVGSGAYPYLLVEVPGPAVRDIATAAGYASIFANGQGELFALRR